MIFVTVGTHEQPFNRLIEKMDQLVEQGKIQEEVIIQTGYSTYEPKHCTWSKLLPFQDMGKYVEQARIVVTHGGPSSFVMPLQIGKTPVVAPRKREYGEHVNNHQVEFANAVAQRMGTILVAEEMDQLEEILLNYDSVIANMNSGLTSNNAKFCQDFAELVKGMF